MHSGSTSTYTSVKDQIKLNDTGFVIEGVSKKSDGATYTNRIKTSNSKLSVEANDLQIDSETSINSNAEKNHYIGFGNQFAIRDGDSKNGEDRLVIGQDSTVLKADNGSSLELDTNAYLESSSGTVVLTGQNETESYSGDKKVIAGNRIKEFTGDNTGLSGTTAGGSALAGIDIGKVNAGFGVLKAAEAMPDVTIDENNLKSGIHCENGVLHLVGDIKGDRLDEIDINLSDKLSKSAGGAVNGDVQFWGSLYVSQKGKPLEFVIKNSDGEQVCGFKMFDSNGNILMRSIGGEEDKATLQLTQGGDILLNGQRVLCNVVTVYTNDIKPQADGSYSIGGGSSRYQTGYFNRLDVKNEIVGEAIDTTAGGTADSNKLITSGAVNAGLAGYRPIKRCYVGQSGSSTEKPYYKFADIEVPISTTDRLITFKVSVGYGDSTTMVGVLTAHIRISSLGVVENGQLVWEYAASGIDVNKFQMVYINDDENNLYKVELWATCDRGYQCYHFEVLSEHMRYAFNNDWTLYTQYTLDGEASITEGDGVIVSTLATLENSVQGEAAATEAKLSAKADVSHKHTAEKTTGTAEGYVTFVDKDGNKDTEKYNEGLSLYTNGGSMRLCVGDTAQTGILELYGTNGKAAAWLRGTDTSEAAPTVYLPDSSGTLLNSGNTGYAATATSGAEIGRLTINGRDYVLYAPESDLTAISEQVNGLSESVSAANQKLDEVIQDEGELSSYVQNEVLNEAKAKKRTHIVIAAANTQNTLKGNADFTCTAKEADEPSDAGEVINAAIAALGENGGKIELLDGDYYLNETVVVNKSNVVLMGNGGVTIIHQPTDEFDGNTGNAFPAFSITEANAGIKDMQIQSADVTSPCELISQASDSAVLNNVFFICHQASGNGNFYNCIKGEADSDCSYTRIENCRIYRYKSDDGYMFDYGGCGFSGCVCGNIQSRGTDVVSINFKDETSRNKTAIYGHTAIDVYVNGVKE